MTAIGEMCRTLQSLSPAKIDWRNKVSTLLGDKSPSPKEDRQASELLAEWMQISMFGVPIAEIEPHIFKLDAECFGRIFDWLSLRDLHSIGQTCKWLHQIAGQYYQKNFAAASVRCEDDGIYCTGVGPLSGFSPFVEKISVFGSSTNRLRYIAANCESLDKLHLDITLTGAKIKSIKHHILDRIEVIEIENFTFADKLVKHLLKPCRNLKRLYVRDIHQKTENRWLLRRYPRLEHLELTPWDYFEIDELEGFFERNLQLRSFATSANCLWVNRSTMIGSQVKLDDLAIEFDSTAEPDIESLCTLLIELHHLEFYKRLHLFVVNIDQHTVNQMASLHALHQLYVMSSIEVVDLSTLIHLRELGIHIGSQRMVTNMKTLAKELVMLEKVYFFYASSDDILPFIRHSKSLTHVKVRHLEHGTHYDGTVFYLEALNNVRQKLSNAQIVTVYLDEHIYLATKWNTNYKCADRVNIQRAQSYEWTHHFRHFLY